jgi:hypothetical protein
MLAAGKTINIFGSSCTQFQPISEIIQKIWQIELSPETTQGKFYALNRQGALTNTKSLEDTELIYILSRVADLLNSTEAKTEADKRLAHTGGFIALSLYEPSV